MIFDLTTFQGWNISHVTLSRHVFPTREVTAFLHWILPLSSSQKGKSRTHDCQKKLGKRKSGEMGNAQTTLDGKNDLSFSPLGSLGQSEHMSDRFFFLSFFLFLFFLPFFQRHSAFGEHYACSRIPRLELNDKRGQPRHHSRQSRHCPGGTPTVSELLIKTGSELPR